MTFIENKEDNSATSILLTEELYIMTETITITKFNSTENYSHE